MDEILEAVKKWIRSICQEYIEANAEHMTGGMSNDAFQKQFNICIKEVDFIATLDNTDVSGTLDDDAVTVSVR